MRNNKVNLATCFVEMATTPTKKKPSKKKRRKLSNRKSTVSSRKNQNNEKLKWNNSTNSNLTIFDDERVTAVAGFEKGPDFVEVTCGVSCRQYGDADGRLRIFSDGQFLIDCQCVPGCDEFNLTPDEFDHHANLNHNKKWTSNIWVYINDKKLSIKDTCLFRYYRHGPNIENTTTVTLRQRNFHRDEFLHCSSCKKIRRFKLRNADECRIFHDASLDSNWVCSKRPYDKISCEDEEERGSRIIARGCPRFGTCKGCTKCVCTGCFKCRYIGCDCKTCDDFTHFSNPV